MHPSYDARKKRAPRTAIGRLLAEPTVLDHLIQTIDEDTAATKTPRAIEKNDNTFV